MRLEIIRIVATSALAFAQAIRFGGSLLCLLSAYRPLTAQVSANNRSQKAWAASCKRSPSCFAGERHTLGARGRWWSTPAPACRPAEVADPTDHVRVVSALGFRGALDRRTARGSGGCQSTGQQKIGRLWACAPAQLTARTACRSVRLAGAGKAADDHLPPRRAANSPPSFAADRLRQPATLPKRRLGRVVADVPRLFSVLILPGLAKAHNRRTDRVDFPYLPGRSTACRLWSPSRQRTEP